MSSPSPAATPERRRSSLLARKPIPQSLRDSILAESPRPSPPSSVFVAHGSAPSSSVNLAGLGLTQDDEVELIDMTLSHDTDKNDVSLRHSCDSSRDGDISAAQKLKLYESLGMSGPAAAIESGIIDPYMNSPPLPSESLHLPDVNRPLPPLPSHSLDSSSILSSPAPGTPTSAVVIDLSKDQMSPRRIKDAATKAAAPESSLPISSTTRASVIIPKPDSSKKVKPAKTIRVSLLNPPESREDETFSISRPPSQRRLWEAGTCFLRDENGNLVCFGDLFPHWPKEKMDPMPRTVLFFIRHFWCGQCQDYTLASISQLDPEIIAKHNIRVAVISNGSWKIIKRYRELFKCPFPIYVDGPRRLYQLLGMVKMSERKEPLFKGRAAYHSGGIPKQLVKGLRNGFFRLPIANPGTLGQLGGEFVLAPGYKCVFTHRMNNQSDHMEAPDVLRIAGVEHPTTREAAELRQEEEQQVELEQLEREMAEWRRGREMEIERMQRKKAARRGVQYTEPAPMTGKNPSRLGLDAQLREAWDEYQAELAQGDDIEDDELVEGDPVEGSEVDSQELNRRFEQAMALDRSEAEGLRE